MRNLECFFSLGTKKEFVYVREKGGERLRERKREGREKREAETLTQERESETQIN